MEKLLNAINIAVGEVQRLNNALLNAITYANSISKEAEIKIKAATEKEATNTLLADDLKTREAKVSKVENIVKIEEDGRILMKQNNNMLEKLETAQQAFNTEVAKKLKGIAEQTHKNADDRIGLEKEWAAYKKREVELKAREEDYKERIARNIIKGVEGK